MDQKEMERGLAAVGAATCFACFQRSTRWMYNPDELYKDHALNAYYQCVVQTAAKFDTGTSRVRADQKKYLVHCAAHMSTRLMRLIAGWLTPRQTGHEGGGILRGRGREHFMPVHRPCE